MDKNKKGFTTTTIISSMESLYGEAQKAFLEGKNDRASKYIQMIMELVKKNKVRLPSNLKNTFCRKCNSLWVIQKLDESTSVSEDNKFPQITNTSIQFDKKHNLFRSVCVCGSQKVI